VLHVRNAKQRRHVRCALLSQKWPEHWHERRVRQPAQPQVLHEPRDDLQVPQVRCAQARNHAHLLQQRLRLAHVHRQQALPPAVFSS